MGLRTVASLTMLLLFIAFALYAIFYPPVHARKSSIYGEVILVWKPNRPRASWVVEVQEGTKIRKINPAFLFDSVTIHIGDSVRKEKGSEEFFLKRKGSQEWTLFDRPVLFRDEIR
ncbi:hypothetical protein [Flaviaesturariibacter amylovorans]|uniref:Uncharacterized protein n=1 Tax=Flaviaesturariibacter amylovorans TaxID=1084520 RepID=A0ABP8GDW6_9BACT